MGRPEQRPDDARKISIWKGADRCSEYLGVNKVTRTGDKLTQVLRVLGVCQGSILRDTARARSISDMSTLNTGCTRSILGFRYSEILLYSEFFGVHYSGVLVVLEVFGDLGLLLL